MKTLLLIDANALVHRTFHALPPFTAKDGRPTGALFGLSNILIKIFRDNPPEHAAAFFDRPEPTFRKQMFEEYKIHRPKAPDELVSQIIEAHNLFEKFKVKIFEVAGFEADDLLGTAVEKFKNVPDLKIVILTGDLDILQLVDGDKIVVETLKKGISETIIYDETAVRQRFGISPKQLPDYKGLVGDASDNIPGIKGVGPKTATAIVQKYKNLENFFESKDAKYQKILDYKNEALFSKKLATIHIGAPLKIENISELEYQKFDSEKIIPYFKQLGFQSLINRLTTNPLRPPRLGEAGQSSREASDLQLTTKIKKEKLVQQSIFENSDLSTDKQKNLSEKIIEEIEIPLTPILKEMKNWGIKVDMDKLSDRKSLTGGEIKELAKKIYDEAGSVFNINSPKQLLEILKEKFGLKIKSTNFEKLNVLREKLPVADLVLRYRELFKLKTTYIEPLIELGKKDKNNRVHPTFVQLKAATGRITCENPNLQNIPDAIKDVFVADKGFKLASFDYSQIELRILASITNDQKMLEAFEKSLDIHRITASQIFNVSLDSVTGKMRQVAKTLNFGIVYGMGARLLAQESGLPLNEAKKFISEYFNDFPAVKKWREQIVLEARQSGFVENLNGRKRMLPEIISFNQRIQAEAERMAINFPIQSLAADIIKLAMIKTKEELAKLGFWEVKAKMLLTIHDELVFEILDDADLEKIVGLINKTMESVYKLPAQGGKVFLKVNSKIGNNWGEI